MKAVSIALFAAAGLYPAVGFAQVQVPYTVSSTIVNGGTTTLNLPYFDSSLGTLTGVYFSTAVSLANIEVELDNDANKANTGWGFVSNTASAFSGGAVQSSLAPFVSASDFSIIQQSGVYQLSSTTGDAINVFNATNSTDYAKWVPAAAFTAGDGGNIAAGDIDLFKGTGNFAISLNTTFLTAGLFSGGDGYFRGSTADATFSGSVVYTYNAIPEPSTYAMILGACTLGLVGWRRFRK